MVETLVVAAAILGVSFLTTLAATPLCRRLALRANLVDRPDGTLKPHARPTPYLGGVAVLLGWGAGILVADAGFHALRSGPAAARVLAAGVVVTALGLIDDLRPIRPGAKLLALAVLALAVGWLGTSYEAIGPLSVPIALVVVTVVVLATNLLDGMDGLCAGVVAIAAVGLVALEWIVRSEYGQDPLHALRVALPLAILGATLGFLPYNRAPARIFLGDAGALLLGLSVASVVLLHAREEAVRSFPAALVVFGLPILALGLVIRERLRAGHPLLQGDRRHFYDRWSQRGWPVRRVVHRSYLLAFLFALIGCVSMFLSTGPAVALYVAALGAAVWLIGRWAGATTAGT